MFTARSKLLHIDEFDSSNFSCCWLVRRLNYQQFRKCPRTIGTTELDGAGEYGLSMYPGKETRRVMSGRQFGAPILTSPFLFRLNVSTSFFFSFSSPQKHLFLSVLETWGRLPDHYYQASAAEESRCVRYRHYRIQREYKKFSNNKCLKHPTNNFIGQHAHKMQKLTLQ